MPKDEKFWNPYRMIPVRDKIDRKPPLTDEKFHGNSGLISCTLENLTSIFIGKNHSNPKHKQFLTCNGRYVIPGSSLKGMLRSLAEIVGGGCNVTGQNGIYSKDQKACDKADNLCITCRMFGMMERGSGARVHKGNVGIGDALIKEDSPRTKTYQILLSNCGTRHEPFYRTPKTGKLDGKSRKSYFHQPLRKDTVPNVPQNLRSRAWDINALLPGHHFDFEIQFSNLSKEELELLIYVLVLEEDRDVVIGKDEIRLRGPLRHKIGNAKPLGLGTCHITINKFTYFANPEQRYKSLLATGDMVYEGIILSNEISKLIDRYSTDASETMQQLRKMMIWDENDPRDFAYPDYYWFQNPANSQKTLKEI